MILTSPDPFRLDGKVAAITGAGSGIGASIALLFGQRGASIAVLELDPIAGNRTSECVRVCVRPPAGYEINAAAGISGTTSHAWSQTFNPQWFDDKKIACIFVKNWSDGQASVATLTVGVCRAGAGCANTAPPPPPAPSPVARERPYSPPLTARQASIRN